jgi:hypothetical protein
MGSFGEFFSKQEKKDFLVSFRYFAPFFKIKIIKLVTSRPRHFIGRHL